MYAYLSFNFTTLLFVILQFLTIYVIRNQPKSVGAVDYTNCISEVGKKTQQGS